MALVTGRTPQLPVLVLVGVQVEMKPKMLNRVDPRRLIDRRGLRPDELLFAEICVAARCRYVGINRAVPECGLEALIIFLDDYGSSLALTPAQFTLQNVRAHLAKSNAHWARVLGE